MIQLITALCLLFLSYLIGSVPTGYCFAKFFFNVDITSVGSKNIGATNVARILGKKYFFLIFLIDSAKAFGTLYFVDYFLSICPDLTQGLTEQTILFNFIISHRIIILSLCAFFLLLGNAFSCFLQFRGGKGVATSLGIVAFLYPIQVPLIFIGIWTLCLIILRKAFIATLFALHIVPVIYSIMFFGLSSKASFAMGLCYILGLSWSSFVISQKNLYKALFNTSVFFAFLYFYPIPFSFNEVFSILSFVFISVWIVARHRPNFEHLLKKNQCENN